MKAKTFVFVLLVAFILAACTPAAKVASTERPVPTSTFTPDNWKGYSSKFTSNVGTIEYSLRYPRDWVVYPGSTRSEPGLEGQTYIQNFVRVGEAGGDTSEYQVAGTVRLEIYALPCAITAEGCDTQGLLSLVSGVPGVRKVENRDGWTIWTVFLYTKDYRFSLDGYMPGTPEQNNENIQTLDEILSTVVIK
jgi:hypothetical protein